MKNLIIPILPKDSVESSKIVLNPLDALNKEKIDKFYALAKKDKQAAYAYCKLYPVQFWEQVLYKNTKKNHKFVYVNCLKKWMITKNLKLCVYKTQKTLIFASGDKFWYKSGSIIRPLSLNFLQTSGYNDLILKEIYAIHPSLLFYTTCVESMSKNQFIQRYIKGVPINTIVKKQLYNIYDLLAHCFKVTDSRIVDFLLDKEIIAYGKKIDLSWIKLPENANINSFWYTHEAPSFFEMLQRVNNYQNCQINLADSREVLRAKIEQWDTLRDQLNTYSSSYPSNKTLPEWMNINVNSPADIPF